MSCGKDTEPDEAKGELVRIEREGCQGGVLFFTPAGVQMSLYKIHKKHSAISLKNGASLKKCTVTVLKFKMLLE